MKNSYASKAIRGSTEQLIKSLEALSNLTILPTGATQPKEGGSEKGESVFNSDWITQPLSDEELSDLVAESPPFYSDDNYSFYIDQEGNLIVKPAPVHSNSLTPFEEEIDQRIHEAICEAGFQNDDLHTLVQELANALAKRMYSSGRTGFTNHEYQLIQRANELRARS